MPTKSKPPAKPATPVAVVKTTTRTTRRTVKAPPPTPTPTPTPTPPTPTPPAPSPTSDKKSIGMAVLAIAVVLLAIALLGLWGYNSLKTAHATELAAKEAAQAAEAEAIARAEPPTTPHTSRREPPTVVRIDEFTITTQNGDRLLIGLPYIAGHGQEGVYLSDQPPPTELRFAHDSKWAKSSSWTRVQIAHWDPNGRRYIPVTGMPLVNRTRPDGSLEFAPVVWALTLSP